MNREDIIRMAEEAGFFIQQNEIYSMSTQSDQELTEWIERFAALVASAERERLTDAAMKAAEKAVDVAIALEREACAKVCDVIAQKMDDGGEGPTGNIGWVIDCAEAIRARGQA